MSAASGAAVPPPPPPNGGAEEAGALYTTDGKIIDHTELTHQNQKRARWFGDAGNSGT